MDVVAGIVVCLAFLLTGCWIWSVRVGLGMFVYALVFWVWMEVIGRSRCSESKLVGWLGLAFCEAVWIVFWVVVLQ